MSDVLPEPEDLGAPLASEAHVSFADQLGAEWKNTLDPRDGASTIGLGRAIRQGVAGGYVAHDWDGQVDANTQMQLDQVNETARANIPQTSRDDAKKWLKDEGLTESDVHLGDQDSHPTPVLKLRIDEAHERRDREAAIARGPDSFIPNALGFVTSMGVGVIDPVNVAAFSLPVIGEARTARMIASAGDSIFARAGVKAGLGAAQGAVGTAALQPVDWWLHTRDGQDYTFAQALESVVMGAGIGGIAHSGMGAGADVLARRRGAPLEGSPQDLLLRGLMTGTHVHADQLAEEGVPIGDVPGNEAPIAPEPPAPSAAPHVADVLADLPPAAKEDAVHAAMADAIQGTEPRAAQMLNIAADHDPRIAEAFEPERIRAATIEHEGKVYEGPNHAYALEKMESERGIRLDDISDRALSAGFITTKGRMVDREEALGIAQRQGQHVPEQVHRLPNDAPSNVKGLVAEETRMERPLAQAEKAAQPAIPDLVTAPKPRGRAAADPDTLSLGEHLASKGGLRPDPELKAIYGSDRGPFIPGFGPLVRKSGMSLDEALSSAKQHGYMFDAHDIDNGSAGAGGRTSHGLTPNDLLDHLDAEHRGQKLYKPGHEAATKYDPEQEKHVILGALEAELEKSGAKVSDIDPKLLDRTVEIVHREGTSDVMDAYERAIMEDAERYHAIADARRSDPELADLPGFDKPADAGAAPGDGQPDPAAGGQAGRPDQGAGQGDGAQPQGSRASSARPDLAAAAADPRWRQLADVTPDFNEPDVLEESRAADQAPEPASTLVPEKSLTALETAAADAEATWRRIEPTLTEKERTMVNGVLDQLKLDKDARDKIISDGVACLVGAIA